MVRRSRSQTERKPARIKTSIPAPRVSPERSFVPWHRRRWVQIAAAAIVIAMVAFGVWRFLEARGEQSDLQREIAIFERSNQALLTPAAGALQAMNTAPDAFLNGELSAEEFSGQATTWVEVFREIDQGLRDQEVPESLGETRALLVQGTLIYIDGAKAFLLASKIEGEEERGEAVQQGRSLITHATAVFGMGQRALEEVRVEVGLSDEGPNQLLDQPFNLPEEEAPAIPPELLEDQIQGTPLPHPRDTGG
jgi:hypothetical protein